MENISISTYGKLISFIILYMSAWVQHIRDFAKSKGITYACALSDPNCSITYQASKLSNIRKNDEARKLELGRKVIQSRLDKNAYVKQLKEKTGLMKEDVNVAEKKAPKKPKIVITGEKKIIKIPKVPKKPKIVITGEKITIKRPKNKID